MRSVRILRPQATALLLVLMFIFADLSLPQTMEGWSELDDEKTVQRAVSYHAVNADTYITASSPSSTFNTSVSGVLADGPSQESRLLLRFPMNFTASDTVHDASVDLQCTTEALGPTELTAYVASMNRMWNGSHASWVAFASNQLWTTAGAEGAADRGEWEPPVTLTGNGTLTLNVTSLAQNAARSNAAYLSLVVASYGASYDCAMSEALSASDRPQLTMDTTNNTAATSGATVSTDLPVEDGAPWMEADFLLQAVTTPVLSYDFNTGADVEIQLSNDADWRSETDEAWHFSTLWSTFASTGTSGAYNLPSSLALENGTTMHMRVRAVDTNDQWGPWDSTSFLLPTHNVVDNGDGTATMTFGPTDTGLEQNFLQDATVSETSKTITYGDGSSLEASMTSNKERLVHFRTSLNQLGLHDNLTIVNAEMKLTRSSYTGDPVVSLHGMEESGLWVESEITWNRMSTNGFQWYDGGRSNGTATMALADGNQSSNSFTFDLDQAVQNYLDNGDDAPLDMLMAVRGKYESYTNGEGILFHSAEASNPSDAPSFAITYEWGSGTPPASVSLTAPADGLAIWNQTGHNLSGNTQPSLNWSAPATGDDLLFELATDEDFRLRELRVDTRVDNDFNPTDGTLAMTGGKTLEVGNMYFWRMATVDSDDHYGEWVSSSFLVSSAESTWLGGDRYEFRMKHGNGSQDNQYPACMDTYIDSAASTDNFDGDSEMTIDYNPSGGEISGLLGCNLVSNSLPSGYAVESAQLSMTLTSSTFGSPTIAVWESTQNDWNAEDATWASYDGTNAWDTAGAKGTERSSLLDSVSVGNSFFEGDTVQWNVTLAVQNAMREDRRVDFITGMLGAGSGGSRTAYFSTAEDSMSNRPELSFVYVPGSDALPSDPAPSLPVNGSWSIGTGVDLTPIAQPELVWSFAGSMALAGYIVQLDTQSDFSSVNSLTYTSWNDAGFDVANTSFTLQSDLDDGETWHWRVRAVSATNQIGNWSSSYHFQLPDLNTVVFNSTKASVELRHHGALPHLNTPHLVDTYVIENGTGSDDTHENATTLRVGEQSTGYQSAALIRIPLAEIPQPSGARVTGAELSLFAEYGSAEDEPVAIRPVLQPWTTAANATTYDGTNTWSALGGRDIGVDIGGYVDLVNSVSDDWMDFDVTEAVQAALANSQNHVSLMVYTSSQTTDEIVFTSTQGSASEAPYMTLVWEDGTVATPTVSGVNTAPSTGTVVWDATSHALKADRAPTFAWTYSGTTSATDWRVFIQADASDDMAGLYTYDSRTTPSAFDITNLTFTPSSDLSFAQEIRWMVQPINNGMLGPRSASTIFYLPNDVGEEVNSTHATLSIQEGSIVPSLAYPATTQDTYLDTGTIYTNRGSSSSLFVGRSQVSTSNPNLRSMSLVNMNFSALPLPGTFEVVDASLEFNVVNTYQSTLVAVSEVNSAWSESSVYAYPAGNTSSWAQTGGFSLNDHDVPFNAPEWVNNTGSVAFNVTALVQHALSNNIAALDVLLFPVELDGGVDGRVQFASSESTNIDVRPRLNLTYRTTTSWTPTAPTGLLPADGSTLWNTSQPRPSGVNDSDFSWATSYSNETQFVVCGGDDPLFLTGDTTCYNSNDILAGLHDNITLDLANDTANNADMEKGDFWQYWRIRADQGDRIGEWSAVHKYRNPVDQGSDDGNGNHTLNISRGSIFEQTGLLPSVPDVEIDSNSTVNRGSSSSVVLGVNSLGTGESRILMEFDLSNMPWPSAMTPTQMMLRMYQPGVSGTSSTTIAAYACSSFTESSVVWATAPTCSTTEITRSTLTLNNPFGWMEWDLTSLAQSNIANGNTTMTFMLAMIGSTGSSHSFYSSEYSDADYHPHLVLDYVDNVNGIVPPGQPMLTSPADGQVLYAEDNGLLTPSTQPVLTWTPVSGATGYIVTVANSTGVYKFKSWEDSEITNTTFRFANNLSEGQLFSWWVQGVNQSIPGPSSARWSFAVGDPDHTYNNDYTYTYAFQTGNEIGAFGHTNIQDTSLYSEYPQTNFAGESTISAGDYCGTLWADECRINIGLNAAQIPFAQYQQVHSASLGLFVESWTSVQGATSVSFSVHPITNANWGAASATWNGTTAGGTWGAPGMQAGVDYGDAVSTTTANVDTTGWLWFDISTPGMTITSQQAWIIIATPNTGHAHASFYSGSTVNADYRPQILFNTTNISSVSISPTGSLTTDADTALNFNSVAYDHLSMVQSPPMSWSSSTGNIGSNGLFTPTTTGLTTITSCFGLVCGTQSINVTAGAPTELIVTPLSATISADESLTITAHMVDQHGNMVPGEPITYTPTNGSMSAVVPNIFQPYAVGSHVVRVAHNVPSGEFVDVAVTVEAGAPSYFELGGCDGTVPAGVWCDITIDLYDQFGNALDLADAGNLTWTTTNGNYSEIDQKYFPDHVGVWWLNLTSVSGAMDELQITVGHGAIDYLELNASSTSITADDRVYINTTRVDVRGNRLAVVLPADNWTKTSDGQLTPGAPAIWDPVKTGSKILEARYETELTQMVIDVSRGQTQTLRITVEGEIATWQHFDITADDTLEAKIFAIDGKGNQWAVPESNWSLDHPTINDASNFIEVLSGDATTFTPYYASDLPYTLTASYSDVNTDLSVSINITVDHGMLNTVSIEGVANDPQRSTGALIEMTSDFAVDFTSELFDTDNNRISSDELTWLEVNVATGDVQDITTQLLLDEMRWEATTVGEWRIDAYSISGTGFNISDSVSITVLHGEAVTVAAALSTTSPTAGDQVDIQVTGTDADGNQFAQDVEWTENGASVPTLSIITSSEGTYLYDAEVAGVHTLQYSVGGAVSTAEITVAAQNKVARLEVNLSTAVLEQLESLDVSIRAFDAYDNEIPVPGSVTVESTGRGTAMMTSSDLWSVTTLDDGPQTITVKVGAVIVNEEITVNGNFQGFFEAGGTLYYVGAGLLALVAIVLLGLGVMFMRNGSGGDWDDDDYDDDEDDDRPSGPTGPAPGPTGPAPGPTGPAPGPSGPPEEEAPAEEVAEEELETTFDEDGTEWWEDEDGAWWYRNPGEEEWQEYTE
ncbi:MAG: hypothetical protein DWC03_04900 [Candidatus Poseidoniales archaeon]|nr:MAG: hypothetical protein DWC03_04900 [Candidatus Poseidoniales archaeon]